MSKREPYLGNPQATIAVLNKYGFTFQKKFGQNFLIDPHVLDKIIRAAEITEDDFVLEIGPGMGTMTQYLAYAAREVYAVEIDKSLIPILEDTLSDYDNVTVINEDILKVDIAKLAEEKNGGRPIKVVANFSADRLRAKTASAITSSGVLSCRELMTLQQPVPFCPAASRMLSSK